MEGNNKEEVLEEKKQNSNPEEFKQVKSNNGKHAKLSPAANSIINNSSNFRNNCFMEQLYMH